ncbi:MAG TPA: glycosyl hydrolase family 18, partial [Lachnoclostridium phytofermentans]|nr:glycosyl hydrolase family 18 [Lachnoclostridium phytofermentans]
MVFKMDKRKRITIIGAVAVVVVVLAIVVSYIVEKNTPSKEVKALSEYYQVPEGEAMVIMDDIVYEKNAKLLDGVLYMDLDTIKDKFNKRFYWDAIENVLIYTTPTEIIKAEVGTKDYLVNKNKVSANYPVVKMVNTEVYVALPFVAEYSDMRYMAYENPDLVVIQCKWGDYLFADVENATQVRTGATIKSPILKELNKGDRVLLINNGGNQANGFLTVMTEEGIRGYVRKKNLSNSYYDKVTSTFEAPVYSSIAKDYKINLTWHQVTNQEANKKLGEVIDSTKGVTTISPTWYRINSKEGTLASLASESYIEKAHGMGIEVWALVDNFDPNVDTYEVLSKTSSRERLINELIAEAIKYNLDGINIDFENLSVETGPHYIQFLRELSVKCRSNQIVLSSDTYVPASYSKFYDRQEQGAVLDYVIIMAYDEHHSKSEEAGSVASIGFLQKAIDDTLLQVPKEKLIMGIPFYSRLWKEYTELGNPALASEAVSMTSAEKTLEANKATKSWVFTTGDRKS